MTTPLRNCALYMMQETMSQYAFFCSMLRKDVNEEHLTQLRVISASTLASSLEALLSSLGAQREDALLPILGRTLFQNGSTELPPELTRQIEVTEAVRAHFFQGLETALETALESYVAYSSDFTRTMA
jgi:hypothetical protein